MEIILKRKIDEVLKEWFENKNKLALLVNGARQIGKTKTIEKFGKKYYQNFVIIDFRENPEYIKCFDGKQDTQTIINSLNLKNNEFNFIEGKTLIFFDEIQLCPKALSSLKTLVKENKFDYICSGSLITFNIKQKDFFPVGSIQHETMYPLDFEEFLWALGIKENLIDNLYEHYKSKKQVDNSINNSLLEYTRKFICVGGMPAAVIEYIESKNLVKVNKIHQNILLDYRADITKSQDENIIEKASICFNSLPSQLDRNNKKFNFNLLNKNARLDRYEKSIHWLWNAGIVNYCYSLSSTELPLKTDVDNTKFKLYTLDSGLLIAMYNDISIYQKILDDDLKVKKGGIYENFIACQLISQGYELMYYHKDPHFSYEKELEIDFCISKKGKFIPIEIKSGRAASFSLVSILNDENIEFGIKAGRFNVGFSNKIFTMPIYFIIFLNRDNPKEIIF